MPSTVGEQTKGWGSQQGSASGVPASPSATRLARAAAAAAWRKGRAGSINYDTSSGPTNSGSTSSNGLSREDLRTIFGFGDLYQAVPEVDEYGQKTGRLVMKDGTIMPSDYRLGGSTGKQAVTGNNSALRSSTLNARLLQGLTVKQAVAFIQSLNEDELTRFQAQLFNAGYFKGQDKPSWGILDDSTSKAFQTLMGDLVRNPDLTVGETLDRATRSFGREMANQLDGKDGKGSGAGGPKEILLQPEITDGQTLADMIDSVSQDLFGRDLAPDRKASLVSQLQQRQKDEFYATTYKQAQIDIANNRPAATTGTGSEVDAFMNAIIGQESGGDANVTNKDSGAWGLAQIMPENWVPWAREAGADPNDRSAANQRKVIGAKMLSYYKQFGNWRDVAIAWYAGPGAIGASWLDAPQDGYPSVNSYADQAMARFGELKGSAGGAAQDPTLGVEFRDKMNVGAEAKAILRAANPAEYEATRFAKRAKEYFSLLAGV